MSKHMSMLENHLNAAQHAALADVQAVAAECGVNLFLAGGALRDMMAGLPIRDLDFVVEGNAAKVAKALSDRTGAVTIATDEHRRSVELRLPSGVEVQIAMSRQEKYGKAGSKPHIAPARIHEHLLSRDFTVNAIAVSLNAGSRGLLLDPTNGLADVEHRELRTIGNYAFYDEPIRLLRLLRLKVRLGFTIAEKTQSQYNNAREAGMDQHISRESILRELRRTATEPNPLEVLQLWESEGLLERVSPVLTGPKLNVQGLAKMHKVRQCIPFGLDVQTDDFALLLYVLTEKLPAKERSAFLHSLPLEGPSQEGWQKLDARAKKLEKELSSASLHKASEIYKVVHRTPAEVALFLLYKPAQRVVQDRIRNYFAKYLPLSFEVTDEQVAAAGATPGTTKFDKLKSELIAKKLDARPKKPPEPPPAPASAEQPVATHGRGGPRSPAVV